LLALDDDEWEVRHAAIQHPNANKDHIDKALDDTVPHIQRAAIKHPNASEDNIDKALDDKHDYFRHAAIKHPNASEDNIDKALKDKDYDVRIEAAKHPNATKEQILKHMGWDAWRVRQAAIQQRERQDPNANEQIDTSSDDQFAEDEDKLKSLSTRELIQIISRPDEDSSEEVIDDAERASGVLTERRKSEYLDSLPTLSDDAVLKFSRSVNQFTSNEAHKEWQRRQRDSRPS